MKILIQINADNVLLCHEALSMAFALASFDHEIQLFWAIIYAIVYTLSLTVNLLKCSHR